MVVLAAAVLVAWAAALPALLGKDGTSWHVDARRIDDCGAPSYRDPVIGQASIAGRPCRPAVMGHAP